jgi:hypothetical protein
MKRVILFIICLHALGRITAQTKKVYTIPADSTRLTGCDSNELIVENHTQNVPGFLYNTGNGRTIFKRGAQQLSNGAYLIGSDTVKAWVQGGNAFGATGILGTLDNNPLDLYTNGQPRARLTNTGNLLLGTTTDNGNLLQVNGPATITGNTNIGVATITSAGNLINTNAILFNHVVSQYHAYQQHDIYISRLENVLYNYPARFPYTDSTAADGTRTIDITIPAGELAYWAPGIVYPEGKVCLSFWEGGIPQSVSVQMYDNWRKAWFGPFTSTTNLSPQTMGYFEVGIPGAFNYVNEIKVTMTPPPGGGINMQNLEYLLATDQEGLANPSPYVGKSSDERIYNSFYWYYGGTNNVCISSVYPSYFLKNVLIGSNTDNNSGNKLQVTGGMSATGGIQFSGLTGDNSQTRVLVSDGSGNLFYRDAATLAASDPIRSSFAVNGTITAKRLRLTAKDWPDYVFKKDYSLPTLPNLERYIGQHHHLPGVTPAAEAEKTGVDVGENQAALLKKIEELTLYVIQQNKKLEAQDKKIDNLSRQVKSLSAKRK